ncbi:MAG: 50S ribosomal protein L32 [Deferribacteraceae bacterium]|jgi:large subunit ribosomal protein L32|nr:50S ribosomal protein L32 [Deferribacteraceae bacterium]
MAGPKTKTTKSKRGFRRSHHQPAGLGYGKCENCGEQKQSHSVCPSCGHYAKRAVIKTEEL